MFTVVIVQPPSIVRKIYPKALWRLPQEQPSIYLTFDDGPTPVVTHKVLSILDQYQAKATFFCVGENAINYPTIVDDILNSGHVIGNHTYNHFNGFKVSKKAYLNNVELANNIFKTTLFRPPYGRLTLAQYRSLHKKYNICFWDILSKDYNSKITVNQCVNNVLANVRNGSILVFHDSKKAEKNCIETLQIVLPKLKKLGYQFLAIKQNAIHFPKVL